VDPTVNDEFLNKAEKAFRQIFNRAKEIDELHFVLSLSPEFRPYCVNTALDAQDAFKDYYNFIQNNRESPIHARVSLAFYSHISEASGFWEVVKNMLNIIDGNKYNMMPFLNLVKKYGEKEGSIAPNANKVMRAMMKYSKKLGFHELAEVFKDAFDADIRNGFAHADYALLEKGICISPRYKAERIVSWNEFQVLLHKAVNFHEVLKSVLSEHLSSYNPPKIVKGFLIDEEPESTYIVSYEPGGRFVIEGGIGYEPASNSNTLHKLSLL
jgi:hypothetical protein